MPINLHCCKSQIALHSFAMIIYTWSALLYSTALILKYCTTVISQFALHDLQRIFLS